MRWIRAGFLRLLGLFRKRRLEHEMAEELAAHLELHTEDNIRAGMTPEEARRIARLKLGGLDAAKEAYRDRSRIPLLENFVRDVRYSLRTLRRNPGFAAVVIFTLGLGIGINTAIFSLIELVALRPLPIPHPEKLVLVRWNKQSPPEWSSMDSYGGCDNAKGDSGCSFPYPTSERFRTGARSLAGVLAFGGSQTVQRGLGEAATRSSAELVSGEFFSVLGVQAQLGRTFLPSDDQPGAEPVAVLSHAFWQNQLGGDVAAVGRTIILNGAHFRIIGISPQGFSGLQPVLPPEMWITLHGAAGLGPGRWDSKDERSAWLFVLGRLRPGATVQQARAELEVLFRGTLAASSSQAGGPGAQSGIELTSGAGGLRLLRGGFLPALQVLAVAAGLVLLIGCANIAGLLVARAAARRRELAARVAVGAARGRLARQLMTESLVLVALGGGLGLLLAWPASQLLATWVKSAASMLPVVLDVRFAWPVVGFALAAGGFAVLLFGLVPGLAVARVEPFAALKAGAGLAGGAGTGGSRRARVGSPLVAVETALALVLLVGAGLFLRTLVNLKTLDPGFREDHLLTVATSFKRGAGGVNLRPGDYPLLRSRLASLPGITSATWSSELLLIGNLSNGDLPGPPGSGRIQANFLQVGPRFFETMGIPVLSGRSVEPQDCREKPNAVWVNQALARRYFPGGNVLGQRIGEGGELEVVGVVGDTKYQSLRSEIQPTLFRPAPTGAHFLLRAASGPRSLEGVVRRTFGEVKPGFRPGPMTSLSDQIDQQLFREHMLARLSTGFGFLALMLAAIGVYGVVAYSVARRTGEIAIRVSLGALPRDVARLVLVDGLLPVLAGIVAGLLAAYGLTRLVTSFLYGVKPLDTLTFSAAATVLLGVAVLACYVPLRRALRVAPMAALRCE